MTAGGDEPTDPQPSALAVANPFTIRRARLDSLDVYELSEEELSTLERGSPASLQLNFALVFLTTGLSLLMTLVTATFPSERTFNVFVMGALVSTALGVVLLAFWWRNRGEVQRVIDRIRGRLGKAKVTVVSLPRSAKEGEPDADVPGAELDSER